MKGIALILLGLSWFSMGQSDLATLARKEKERRAKVAKPAKVLTDDDTKDAGERGAGSVTALGGEAPAAPRSAAPAPDDGKLIWKGQADAARAAIAEAQQRLARTEAEVTAVRADLSPLSAAEAQDPMRLQKKEARIAQLNKEIEALKAGVDRARKDMVELEDLARKRNVPAGWLR